MEKSKGVWAAQSAAQTPFDFSLTRKRILDISISRDIIFIVRKKFHVVNCRRIFFQL
jgi:hypothetical protein